MNTHISPRVLTVEDNPGQLEAMGLYLDSIPKDFKQPLGIRQFRIDKAASAGKAMDYLNQAGESGNPYDLCLLDLSLPQTEGGEPEGPRKGLDILEYAIKTSAVRKVIVVSVFSEYQFVVDSFRGGAFDFVEKPFKRKPLQAVVMNCLQHALIEASSHILNDRIKRLTPYAEKGLAHRYTATFSALISSITRAASEIEKYARDRYGLDPERDAQDALMGQLRAHRESVGAARQEWTKLQALLSDKDASQQVEAVEDLLTGISEKLLPCLAVKKTQLLFAHDPSEKSFVRAFQQDVQAVLKEIIVGGLSELSDCGDERKISVTIERNGTRAIVHFEDDLKTISTEHRKKINEGYSIVPDPELGRAWGLSVAQHIALRGGGELKVEPKPRGNIITYHIPLANHAKDTRG